MASFRGGDEGSAEDDAIVVASGTVEFVVQLSSALSLITLLPGGTGPCDVMVKAKDGWKDKSTVSALLKRAVPGAAISLRGRLERRRAGVLLVLEMTRSVGESLRDLGNRQRFNVERQWRTGRGIRLTQGGMVSGIGA